MPATHVRLERDLGEKGGVEDSERYMISSYTLPGYIPKLQALCHNAGRGRFGMRKCG